MSLFSNSPRRSRAFAFFHLAAFLALASLFACRSLRTVRGQPLAEDASRAHAHAQELVRGVGEPGREGRRAAALEEALRASRIAPDWIAPRRLIDDLRREELRGVEALAEYRARLAENPSDAQALYLAGRLEGSGGVPRFERAIFADPNSAWAHHGLAWTLSGRSGPGLSEAMKHGRRAIELSRDPWERAYFRSALSRYLTASGRLKEARAELSGALADKGLLAGQRISLRVQLARTELASGKRSERLVGFRRALELIRSSEVTDPELEQLVERARIAASTLGVGSLELLNALAADGEASPMRDRLRAELLLEETPSALALGLLDRSFGEDVDPRSHGELLRSARFAAGQFRLGLDEWLRSLPEFLLDESGRARDARVSRVEAATRRVEDSGLDAAERIEAFSDLGHALIGAGWFKEARALAASSQLAVLDLDAALEIDSKAISGLELIDGIRRLCYRVAADIPEEFEDDEAEGKEGKAAVAETTEVLGPPAPDFSLVDSGPIDSLDDLLAAMGLLFARAHERLGGDSNPILQSAQMAQSPRLSYSFVGGLVHPGPRYSASDARAGRGTEGAIVSGLAAELNRIGRFGIFGQVIGRKPDAALLRTVLVEERSGDHLGIPWSGTIAWCEGADVLSNAGLRGAAIGGAALHEGYWVDLDVMRRELRAWEALRIRFEAPELAERLGDVLSVRGFRVEAGGDGEGLSKGDRLRKNRREVAALLGESERVRLTVLRDRGVAGGALGRVSLDELVEVTAIHEEGHLCDRTRFLPLRKHLVGVLGMLAAGGFSPNGVQRLLEYRAQLVALCEVPEPRLPLSDILRAAEGGGSGGLPHADAYAELLNDLVGELDRELADSEEAYPHILRDHTLVHQLHFLTAEEVRTLALRLAERRGMVGK